MAIKGILVDFFGTLAREDDAPVMEICRRIMDASPVVFSVADVARFWWEVTRERYLSCYGNAFMNLNQLEMSALTEVLHHFKVDGLDVAPMMEPILRARRGPSLFEDARTFVSRMPLPYAVTVNADRAPMEQALHSLQLEVPVLITSQDVKSYKPRAELYQRAMETLKLAPEQVLVVGDSAQYDLEPARALGMRTAWVNRGMKAYPGAAAPDLTVNSLLQLRNLMLKGR